MFFKYIGTNLDLLGEKYGVGVKYNNSNNAYVDEKVAIVCAIGNQETKNVEQVLCVKQGTRLSHFCLQDMDDTLKWAANNFKGKKGSLRLESLKIHMINTKSQITIWVWIII